MISATMRAYTMRSFGVAQRLYSVTSSAKLEGPNLLELLALEKKFAVCYFVDSGTGKNRCPNRQPVDARSGGFHIRKRDTIAVHRQTVRT